MRVGSLCSGYGGLDLAVKHHFGARLAWVSEIDPHASEVLAARFRVPNLGDFRDATPDPVDILCAGFPCQPVSSAGRRKGTEDERWLWDDIAAFVGRMDVPPRIIALENVRGLLSANGGDAVRRVVHGLADLGYMGRYGCVRASDVGAPHRRERWFAVAQHTVERRRTDAWGWRAGLEDGATPDTDRESTGRDVGTASRSEVANVGWRGPDLCHGPSDGARTNWSDRAAPPDAACTERRGPEPDPVAAPVGRATEPRKRGCSDAWGAYAPAIERWEHVIGRRAPDPLDGGRLNPRLVEWMMGLPGGWVTDVLPRNPALRVLGNGVVPQQAAHALDLLAGEHTDE